jgi:hypothetical protein
MYFHMSSGARGFRMGWAAVRWMVPLGLHVGRRFEARGYGTLLDNHSAVLCGGNTGCIIAIKGDGLFQGEVLAGLSIRF